MFRDIKLENLLLTEDFSVKLCDLGSASTKQHYPDQNWSMNQRTLLEDELAKYSTPMYRAPEMLDTWANYPINQVSRLQSLKGDLDRIGGKMVFKTCHCCLYISTCLVIKTLSISLHFTGCRYLGRRIGSLLNLL